MPFDRLHILSEHYRALPSSRSDPTILQCSLSSAREHIRSHPKSDDKALRAKASVVHPSNAERERQTVRVFSMPPPKRSKDLERKPRLHPTAYRQDFSQIEPH